MKNLSAVLAAAFLCMNAFAQSQFVIPYQGLARDTGTAAPIPLQHMNARMSIYNGNSAGALGGMLYSEADTFTTSAVGTFSVSVGNGVVQSGSGIFSSINWAGDSAKYLKVEIDPSGGTSFLNLGTSQLLSVPYALYAGKSGTSTPLTGSPMQVPYFSRGDTLKSDQYFSRDTDYTTQITKVTNHVVEGMELGQDQYSNSGDGAYFLRYDSTSGHLDLIGEYYWPTDGSSDTVHQIGVWCMSQSSLAYMVLIDSDPVNPVASIVTGNGGSFSAGARYNSDTAAMFVVNNSSGSINGIVADTSYLHILSNGTIWNWPTEDAATGGNNALTCDGAGNLSWSNTLAPPLISKSSNYTLTTSDYTVIFTATGLTATLPLASSSANRMYIITNKGGGALSISAYIDLTNSSNSAVAANSSITLQSDGTNWQQIR